MWIKQPILVYDNYYLPNAITYFLETCEAGESALTNTYIYTLLLLL